MPFLNPQGIMLTKNLNATLTQRFFFLGIVAQWARLEQNNVKLMMSMWRCGEFLQFKSSYNSDESGNRYLDSGFGIGCKANCFFLFCGKSVNWPKTEEKE